METRPSSTGRGEERKQGSSISTTNLSRRGRNAPAIEGDPSMGWECGRGWDEIHRLTVVTPSLTGERWGRNFSPLPSSLPRTCREREKGINSTSDKRKRKKRKERRRCGWLTRSCWCHWVWTTLHKGGGNANWLGLVGTILLDRHFFLPFMFLVQICSSIFTRVFVSLNMNIRVSPI